MKIRMCLYLGEYLYVFIYVFICGLCSDSDQLGLYGVEYRDFFFFVNNYWEIVGKETVVA